MYIIVLTKETTSEKNNYIKVIALTTIYNIV